MNISRLKPKTPDKTTMNLKFSAIILLGTLAVSCSQPVKTAKDLTVLDLSQDLTVESKMTLSQIATDIRYVKLESNPECFIKTIDQFSITNNYILIFDMKQPKVLLFNRQGKFLRNISQQGGGPGEFYHPNDVRISRDEKYILMNDIKKVIRFGFDGKLVGETKLPHIAWKIDTYNDGLIGFFNSNYSPAMDNFTIVFFDWNGKITGKLMRRNWAKIEHRSTVRRDMLYCMNDELRINQGYFDTVYAVGPNRSIEPKVVLIDPHAKEDFSGDNPNFCFETWIETRDFLFLKGCYKNRMHTMYMDKKTGLLYHIPFNKELRREAVPNDLDGGAPFWPLIDQDESLYQIQEARTLKSVLDNPLVDKSTFMNQALRDKMLAFKKNLSDDDGPVLIELKLKM
jgi:hypothetical protein